MRSQAHLFGSVDRKKPVNWLHSDPKWEFSQDMVRGKVPIYFLFVYIYWKREKEFKLLYNEVNFFEVTFYSEFLFSKGFKMFKLLNQCFARLQIWKSVSDSRNLFDGATAVLLETLFQNRSRAKHWFKNSNILVYQ